MEMAQFIDGKRIATWLGAFLAIELLGRSGGGRSSDWPGRSLGMVCDVGEDPREMAGMEGR